MLRPIPRADEIEIKERFRGRYSRLTDFEEFMKYSLSFLRRCIRVNELKISIEDCTERLSENWGLSSVPWCREGFWIESKRGRIDIGNTIEHCLGYIYVQEAVSMIPPIVLQPKPGDLCIDMCAAPGSKATQIAAMMKNKGILIANDYKGIRLKPLGLNLQRSGVSNAIATLMEGRFFKNKGMEFDKILVDAPCSGTGTIRKSLKTLAIWNPDMVKKFSSAQKQLVDTAFSMLKKGGTLVYSTCSLEPEENEGVVDFLLSRHENAEIEKIELNINRSKPILEFEGKNYNKEINNCLRIWPQDNDTEGFFVAKVVKIK